MYSAKRPTTDWLLERELRKIKETKVQVGTSRIIASDSKLDSYCVTTTRTSVNTALLLYVVVQIGFQ